MLLVFWLVAAGAGAANAQCYLFTSSTTGVSIEANITTILNVIGPIAETGGGRSYGYGFTGTYTLTIGQSTYTSSGLIGSASILYAGSPLSTTMGFLLPNPNVSFGANVGLQGSGDLMPNGLTPTLPPISSWVLPVVGMHYDYIGVGSGTSGKTYQIDSITNCAAASAPTIALSATELQFSFTTGGAAPAPQTITITNSGGGTFTWSATANVPWINLIDPDNTLAVSIDPAGLGAGPHTGIITITAAGATNSPLAIPVSLTVTSGGGPPVISNPSLYVPVTPCRIADTRNANGPFGGPAVTGGMSRDFAIPLSGCSIPATASAYSLNVAVVPRVDLGYLTVWPAGQSQPVVATLNSLDGRIKSNAAIVPAGANGAISVFATDTTDGILDINGYFVPGSSPAARQFFPLTPCRIADTRNADGPLGGPGLTAQSTRSFPIAESTCGIPPTAQAYSLNFAAVPEGPLGYLTAWAAGQPQPVVASLNAVTGTVTANAVIVPAGAGQAVDVFTTDDTDLVIDINGYFGPAAVGGLSLYAITPCRVLDTRQAGAPFSQPLNVDVTTSGCGVPVTAQAFVFNATVVPPGPLGYLTMWPEGEAQPIVSTLNALDGAITNNMAIVPTNNGSITVFPSNPTQLVLDIFGFFAP